MSHNDDDEEFGDFGDFQTCQQADISAAHHADDDKAVPTKGPSFEDVNIFERDPSQFDNVLSDFDQTINELFPLINQRHSPTVIHSQEDSITDCPFWWNLSGNFKNFQTIPFKKSKSFDLFLSALRSATSFSDNYNDNNNKIITENNNDFNDDELASELDMHSLILDSSTNSIQQPGDETINADKIIEEIENIMKADSDENDDELEPGEQIQSSDIDDLVGLNASTLLNAALDSWTKYQDLFSDEEDNDNDNDHNSEFRSLPVTISTDSRPTTESSFYQNKIRTSVTNNSLESSQGSTNTSEMSNSTYDKSNNSFAERIQQLSIVKLNELLMEMERIIQIKSEILIRELAVREEAENEKELKNIFISSLLNVQNKRRLLSSSKDKKQGRNKLARRKSDVVTGSSTFLSSRFVPNFSTLKETLGLNSLQGTRNSATDSIYLTTIIPYNPDKSCLDNSTLEMLIKLLDAMNENSPTVPQLLTDYILKVICM